MTRSEGERVRAQHILKRLRGCLDGVEIALQDPCPVGYEAGGAVTQTAVELAIALAKLDAYQRSEWDERKEQSLKGIGYQTADTRSEWDERKEQSLKEIAANAKANPKPRAFRECVTCGFYPCMCDQQ